MNDRQLVQKLLAKEEAAERHFFHAYREKIYQACVYILGPHDPEAEDVTQEVFMIALRKLPEFQFRSSLFRWLYRICVFLCYKRVHKRGRHVARLEEELENLSGPLSVERERLRQEEEERKRLARLVLAQRDQMGEPCRGLLELRDDGEKSYADIAEALKIPIGTVMSRLARCKEALKQLVLRALQEETHA